MILTEEQRFAIEMAIGLYDDDECLMALDSILNNINKVMKILEADE